MAYHLLHFWHITDNTGYIRGTHIGKNHFVNKAFYNMSNCLISRFANYAVYINLFGFFFFDGDISRIHSKNYLK